MTSDTASEKLKSVLPLYRHAWELAFNDILTTYNNPGWNNGCRSHVLQMQAVVRAKEALFGASGVKHMVVDKRDLWEINKFCIIRLKQLDEKSPFFELPDRNRKGI